MTSLRDPPTLPCGPVSAQSDHESCVERVARRQARLSRRASSTGYTQAGAKVGYGLIVTGNLMVDRTQLGEPAQRRHRR